MNKPAFIADFISEHYLLTPVTGGLSNHNFCLCTDGQPTQKYFVRQYGQHYKEFGNCAKRESQAQLQAAHYGLAPNVHFCSAQGMVTDWVDGQHWSLMEQKQPQHIQRLAYLVAELHQLPAPDYQLDLALRLTRYFEQIEPVFKTPLFVTQFNFTLALIQNKLTNNRVGFCHHDINPLNVLVGNDQRLWLLDWEFAAQGNCDFDITTLLQTFNWQGAEQAYFLSCYNERMAISDASFMGVDSNQLEYMAIIVNMMTLCWAIIMHQNHPTAGYFPLWQDSAHALAQKISGMK